MYVSSQCTTKARSRTGASKWRKSLSEKRRNARLSARASLRRCKTFLNCSWVLVSRRVFRAPTFAGRFGVDTFRGDPAAAFLRSFKVASLILPTGDLPIELSSATTESWSSPTTPTTAVSSAVVQTAYRADIQNGHIVPRHSPASLILKESRSPDSIRSSDLEQETGASLGLPPRSNSFGQVRPSRPILWCPHSRSPPFSNLAPDYALPCNYDLANIPAKAAAILGLNEAGRILPFPASQPRKPSVRTKQAPLCSPASDDGGLRESVQARPPPLAKRHPPPAPLDLSMSWYGQRGHRDPAQTKKSETTEIRAARDTVDEDGLNQVALSGAAAGRERGAADKNFVTLGRQRKSSVAKLSGDKMTRSLPGRRGRETAPGMKS